MNAEEREVYDEVRKVAAAALAEWRERAERAEARRKFAENAYKLACDERDAALDLLREVSDDMGEQPSEMWQRVRAFLSTRTPREPT